MHATESDEYDKTTLDPILTIQVPLQNISGTSHKQAAVTSLCFVECIRQADDAERPSKETDDGDSSSDSDYEELNLQCRALSNAEKRHETDATASAREISARFSLTGRLLATCESTGSCVVWDLGQRKVIQNVASCDRGPGIMLRRLENKTDCSSRLMYQSRNDAGTVSLHDLDGYVVASKGTVQVNTLAKFDTFSQSFCSAAPCQGDSNLIVMPTQEHSFAVVRDWRIPEYDHPVALFHASRGRFDLNENCISTSPMEDMRRHGMVTSLAMVESNGKFTIGCGMESGIVAFHDLAMLNSSCFHKPCHISLGTDPVLSLDLTSSSTETKPSTFCSLLAVAGLAGNADDLTEIPEADRGRIAVVKAIIQRNGEYTAKLRSRIAISDSFLSDGGFHRKPGVSVCRFRSDGRIFAVGGWDYRLRIFDRAAPVRQLALLRGHGGSISATDWAADASESGLLATGSSDGRIQIWRCFSLPSDTSGIGARNLEP